MLNIFLIFNEIKQVFSVVSNWTNAFVREKFNIVQKFFPVIFLSLLTSHYHCDICADKKGGTRSLLNKFGVQRKDGAIRNSLLIVVSGRLSVFPFIFIGRNIKWVWWIYYCIHQLSLYLLFLYYYWNTNILSKISNFLGHFKLSPFIISYQIYQLTK